MRYFNQSWCIASLYEGPVGIAWVKVTVTKNRKKWFPHNNYS
jgi:hypothetical protein